jgi:hypothetical protein
MNKKWIGLILMGLSGISFSQEMPGICDAVYCRPYVGVEIQHRGIDFKASADDVYIRPNYISHKSMQGHLFAGIKLDENFSVEIGSYLSQNLIQPDPYTRVGLKGQKITFLKYFPVSESNFSVMVGGGITHLDACFENLQPIPVWVSAAKQEAIRNANNLLPFEKINIRKEIMHLKLGFHQMMTKNFALRANVLWENTTHFKSDIHNIRGKDSITYSLGTVWYFY